MKFCQRTTSSDMKLLNMVILRQVIMCANVNVPDLSLQFVYVLGYYFFKIKHNHFRCLHDDYTVRVKFYEFGKLKNSGYERLNNTGKFFKEHQDYHEYFQPHLPSNIYRSFVSGIG